MAGEHHKINDYNTNNNDIALPECHDMADGKVCYLGELPVELLLLIISEMDSLRTLGNFARTCWPIYWFFKERRRQLVEERLRAELGPVLADAQFLYGLPYEDPGIGRIERERYWKRVNTAAGKYQDMLTGGAGGGSREREIVIPSYGDVVELCHTFNNMEFLARAFFRDQQHWAGWLGGGATSTKPPSRSERLRVLRALYRRQIVCYIWAPTRRQDNNRWWDVVPLTQPGRGKGAPCGLFTLFKPWELEQIAEIDYFVTRLRPTLAFARDEDSGMTPVLSADTISREMAQLDPDEEAQWDAVSTFDNLLVRHMRAHPHLVDGVLRVITSLGTAAKLLGGPRPTRIYLNTTKAGFNELLAVVAERSTLPCLTYHFQDRTYFNDLAPAGGHKKGGKPVSFVGEAVDLPPFGWVDAVRGRYLGPAGLRRRYNEGNWLDWQVARFSGFTFWDRWRVQDLKKLEPNILKNGWIVK